MKLTLYICYEENGGSLPLECGAISSLCVKSVEDAAVEWMLDRVEKGLKNNFIIDEEYGDVSKDKIKISLQSDNIERIIMFKSYQENWDTHYVITVEKLVVE